MVSNHVQPYKLPPRLYNENGSYRHVGVEIEMSGIEVETICNIATQLYHGTLLKNSPYEAYVKNSTIGDIKVELDFQYIQQLYKLELKEPFDIPPLEELKKSGTEILAFISKNIVPVELVFPPIKISKLSCLDPMIRSLSHHEAKGTKSSVFFAFGVHLNPELPNFEAETILHYIQAFICLESYIKQSEDVNITRKISPFINEYPKKYKLLILSQEYKPTIAQLIDDYLEYNPTRNRALDMLPLFLYLDEERVKSSVKDNLIKPRPTLHYRLPNSDIDNPEWSLSESWNHYILIEQLTNNPGQLNELCKKYLQVNQSLFLKLLKPWTKRVSKWLKKQK